MSVKKRVCKCPPKLQKVCKQTPNVTDCKDVAEIIEALTFQAESSKTQKKPKPPSFKTKPFKPRHYKDTCVPMAPSMHTRLRYIGHCSNDPPSRRSGAPKRKGYPGFDFASSSDEGSGIIKGKKRKDSGKKRVTYLDMVPAHISMPVPPPVVKHTTSDKEIFNVASPKVSGEVIRAQKAVVKSTDYKPPFTT
ncbi:unnamed protein product [Leptosia nina]|uniref:Uncharacterized protein n=1 Tax=Leptosia nina TaxID=320188 RepID=A0AAV1J736_9NEOP